ncbi:MAG: response regulator [Myxococcales bacterium]|nr:response regulator [Myxococcales bacterium]
MPDTHSVLVVDDDVDIRAALIDVLEDHGFEAVGAINGKDALDKLRAAPEEEKPCLIVLDLMMPVMDGATFRDEQLKSPDLASIPVVVVTAYRDIADQARMKITDFLRKPLNIDDLIAAVKRYCDPLATMPSPSPA